MEKFPNLSNRKPNIRQHTHLADTQTDAILTLSNEDRNLPVKLAVHKLNYFYWH